jgi:hypothetical protein
MVQSLCHPYRTVGNACVEELVGFDTNDNIKDWRTVRGVVAFVYLDCLTLAPAPDDKQDVAWLQPGVRLPRDNGLLIQAYEDLWNRSAEVSMASQNGDAVCYDAVANATECVVAANDLLMLGMMVVQTDSGAKKGKGYELTVRHWPLSPIDVAVAHGTDNLGVRRSTTPAARTSLTTKTGKVRIVPSRISKLPQRRRRSLIPASRTI